MTDGEILEIWSAYLSSSGPDREAIVESISTRSAEDGFYLVPARLVILLREAGRLQEAEDFAKLFTEIQPFVYETSWQLGYSYAISGNPEKAILYLQKAVDSQEKLEALLWLSNQHAILKQGHDATETLERTEKLYPAEKNLILIYRDFCRFFQKYGRNEAEELRQEIVNKFTTKDISIVEADIQHAVLNRKPYLLLRLGDGEGACIILSDEEEAANAAYYRANREEFVDIWFKNTNVLDDLRFQDAMRLFNDSIGKADAIGGSMYVDAIKTEFDLSSRRGIAWVVNTMRKLLALADADPIWAKNVPVFNLVIHYDLLLTGALKRILTNLDTIGLISCHSELPDALSRTYGISDVEFIKVPGEQIHANILGGSAVAGTHWPDRFYEICEFLDKPVDRHGKIWLVAAGMLGKIYAAKLKAAGAVVLDIGAVADLWMGKTTRMFPSLPEDVRLKPKQDIFTLVDVGGLGGLGEDWLPYIEEVRAVLFEPNPPEALMARAKIASSPGGIVVERALSNRSERRRLHVAKSLGCTSLFKPDEAVLAPYSIAPAFRITHEIDVDCVRFDSLVASGEAPQPDAVKIDVQGFEYNVLEGFGGTLHECLGVKVEAHLYPIYHGQKLFSDVIELLNRAGLTLRRVQPVDHFDGDIVEVDAWFTCSPDRAAKLPLARAQKLAFLEKVWGLEPRKPSFGAHQFTD